MRELMTDPATWTVEQWLAACILGFILLAILVMIHRLLTILKISQTRTYRPNFRRLRKFHQYHTDDRKPADDEVEQDQRAERDERD
ncbi:MAG: hypothetical protein R3F41_13625 [Gammaproteobacteria bacterium]|nr:hypothetical protein [Pseudomonadales bacterium]MCP5349141.1 hypothetical protein [Pseudomonadales bacterium]